MLDQILSNPILEVFENFKDRNAFCIDERYYTYKDLADHISKIRMALKLSNSNSKNIGLVANDDIETYASIFAIWLDGYAYVPVNPETSRDRNEIILELAEVKTILDSSENQIFTNFSIIDSKNLPWSKIDLVPKQVSNQELAYIFFTSGTTGIPRGVPITRSNLIGFVKSFDKLQIGIKENDRCLQMFDLTFDLSVISYLIPILKGACVYTIPKNKLKYVYIFELMDEQKISVALMVPSILHYLREYFDEMNFPSLKYSLFCGEALQLDITEEWSKCIPNAKIMNLYGPTENTIFCTHYAFNSYNKKVYNGVLSIGKAMYANECVIVDMENKIVEHGVKGELCLNGIQLTPGYWHNENKNKEVFISINYKGKLKRFYKTGDFCFIDEEGDILYIGRLDQQTKIQGYRVELSEIEFHASNFLNKINVIAIDFTNKIKNNEIGLVIESKQINTNALLNHLKIKIPVYMIPTQIKFVTKFPLNTNGKIKRNELKQLFK